MGSRPTVLLWYPPPTAVGDSGTIYLQALSTTGQRLKGSNPEYPSDAKAAHLTGTVLLEATIGTDGHIHNLQLISSPGTALTQSAEKAVSTWVYKPFEQGGRPVEARTLIHIAYRLTQ